MLEVGTFLSQLALFQFESAKMRNESCRSPTLMNKIQNADIDVNIPGRNFPTTSSTWYYWKMLITVSMGILIQACTSHSMNVIASYQGTPYTNQTYIGIGIDSVLRLLISHHPWDFFAWISNANNTLITPPLRIVTTQKFHWSSYSTPL